MGVLIVVCFVIRRLLYVHSSLDGEEKVCCFAWFVFLVSRDCCVALPRGAIGLPAVCDCGIS